MQLAGDLSKVSFPSLIQLVRNSGMTGSISLTHENHNAVLYLEKGKIVHFESDIGTGKEEFFELFLWVNGKFSIAEDKLPNPPHNFPADEPLEKILREGIAYLEGAKYLGNLKINQQTVLAPTEAAKNTLDVPLLNQLDGKKTLMRVLAQTNLSNRDYIAALYHILLNGLAKVIEAPIPKPIETSQIPQATQVSQPPQPINEVKPKDIPTPTIQEAPIKQENKQEKQKEKPVEIVAAPPVVVKEQLLQPDQINLPAWVAARLKQDNADLTQAIVDMVIWVDRIKCWMYQADVDFEKIIDELSGKVPAANTSEPSSVEF